MASMSRFHFARTFKTIVGLTPKQYLATVRLRKLKGGLERSKSVDAAAYDAGYGSTSRIYEMAASRLGMTPAQYRRAGEGVSISYAFAPTPFGLDDDRRHRPRHLFHRLRRRARGAAYRECASSIATRSIEPMVQPYDPQFRAWIDSLVGYLSDDVPKPDLPLDIRATAFQMRVWNYLAHIPSGEVRSYGEVAAAIGATRRSPRRRASLRAQPGGGTYSVSPRHSRQRRFGRLSLGPRPQTRAHRERTRAASTNAARMSDFDLVVVGTGSSGNAVASVVRKPDGESRSSTSFLTVGRARCAVAIRRKCSSARPKSSIGCNACRAAASPAIPGSTGRSSCVSSAPLRDPVPQEREAKFRELGIATYHGTARFTASTALDISGEAVEARTIVLAAGDAPGDAAPAGRGAPHHQHRLSRLGAAAAARRLRRWRLYRVRVRARGGASGGRGNDSAARPARAHRFRSGSRRPCRRSKPRDRNRRARRC